MKSKFKIITAIIVISILSVGQTTIAADLENEKEFNQAWVASDVQTLEIANRFGEIKVNNDGGSQITIDVKVTVDAVNQRKANELLSKIDVRFSKSGTTAKAVTSISKDFKSQKKFSIDYVVNIPSDKNLTISNKYGDIVVNALNANGDFLIQYGNLTANSLNAPKGGQMKVVLEYGNASISSAANLNLTTKHSNLTLGEIGDLKLESKYSVVEIEEGSAVEIASKYDKIKFEEVEWITGMTKYSDLKIEELSKGVNIESGYGGLKVSEVDNDFESISITNSYGEISLGLDGASYDVDASCDYCGISYSEDEFSGDKIKEKYTQKLIGTVGSGNGGTVKIKSRYGSIKLDH